jgi:D-alanyl-D-alanine carboxypeptidase (penicillin-binding protein 5/6)
MMRVARRASISRAWAAVACQLLVALIAAALAQPSRASPPRLSARAAILVAPQTRQELFGLAPSRELAIASTTKLMTALVTLEHAHLSKVFAAPDYHPAPADSQIGIVPGERMSVHDLLLGLLLPSGDDAAEDLAYNVGRRSVGRFVGMMNRRARQLGLHHTHYSTPIGLDTPGNFSTAADLAKLASYLLANQPFFAHAVAQRSAVLRSGNHVRVVTNRNDLVAKFPWIHGVKTGHTLDAGYVLVGSGRRSGMSLLSVVLGTSSEASRDANTLALLNYGYANFSLQTPVRKGAVMARPTIKDKPGAHAVVLAARTFKRVLPRSRRVRIRVQVPHQLKGPLKRHTVVGAAVVLDGKRPIARIPLLLARSVPAVGPLTKAAHFVTRPSTLVSLVVLFLAAIALAVRRWDRARRVGEERAEPA